MLTLQPHLGGFQVGASFTPDVSEETGSYGGFTSDVSGGWDDVIEVGANFVRKFGSVNVALSAGFGYGSAEIATLDDRTEWNLGASVSFAGLTIGAAYRNDDNGSFASSAHDHTANVGVRYARGAWGVGIQAAYMVAEGSIGTGGTEDEWFGIEVGGSYNLGPGVNVNAGVQWHDYDDNLAGSTGDNEAIIFFIGTALSF